MRILFLLLAFFSGVSHANVIINATRVVFPDSNKEYSLKIQNDNKYPVLVQAWVDNGNSTISDKIPKTPFTILPPIFRMEPNQGQTLRIIYNGEPLPADRESVFWVNVFEIPPKERVSENQLELAFRSRIKLFFRPASLGRLNIENAVKNINCNIKKDSEKNKSILSCKNKTGHYISFSSVYLASSGNKITLPLDSFGMIPPFGEIKAKIKSIADNSELIAYIINDQGGASKNTIKVFDE